MTRLLLLGCMTLLAGCPLITPCGPGPGDTCDDPEGPRDVTGLYTDGAFCVDDANAGECLDVLEARIDEGEIEVLLEDEEGRQWIVRWARAPSE